MNKRLDEALNKVRALPDEEQQAAAEILFDYIKSTGSGAELTREQIAEIERRLDKDDIASDEEVRAVFGRLKA
jgi:putative addiction module component (TIGR02574 family)